jgi:hypothetical protein
MMPATTEGSVAAIRVTTYIHPMATIHMMLSLSARLNTRF